MESKIPYKKDLVIKTDEEIDDMKAKERYENLQRDIGCFDSRIASEINHIATRTKQKFVIYELREIKGYTGNKNTQKILLESIQSELTKKGYTNYVANIKFDDDKLIILLDDKVKSEADKYISDVNKNNIKLTGSILSIFLIGIIITIALILTQTK
jgi:hypothetical protein